MKAEPPTVSVVIPTYNGGSHLPTSIGSVLSQTRRPTEVIVVDDGSTDRTWEVVARFPEVTYARQENAGPGAARNYGTELSSCDWVAFLDCDDLWLPTFLQCQCEVLDKNPDLAWSAGMYERVSCSGRPYNHFRSRRFQRLIDPHSCLENYYDASMFWGMSSVVCCSTALVRRDVLLDCGGFLEERRLGEDMGLWYRIADSFPRLGFVNTVVARYLRSSSSLTESAVRESRQSLRTIFSTLCEDSGPRAFCDALATDRLRALHFRRRFEALLLSCIIRKQWSLVKPMLQSRGSWIGLPIRCGAMALVALRRAQ